MRDAGPTRAALLEMQDERRALHDGHVFLDEKCLLLAGEMLRQLQQHRALEAALLAAHARAINALAAALGRHGLDGLQVQPALPAGEARPVMTSSTLMGVRLQQARWQPDGTVQPPAAVDPSPELRACREAFAALLDAALPYGAVSGNLARLSQEYRRSVRRARALQDVLLPELERTMAGIEGAIDEGERQEAMAMRHGRIGLTLA